MNPNEKIPLPQGRQVWGFENVHGIQALSSNPPRTRTPLPPFLNPTPRPILRPNVQDPFLNPDPPKFNLPFIISNFNSNESIQSRSSKPPSQDKRISPLPPPFLNLDTTAQNMVLLSGRTFNREPLPPILVIWTLTFPLNLNSLLNNPEQSSSYDFLQYLDHTPVRISILKLIKKSKTHQEVLS